MKSNSADYSEFRTKLEELARELAIDSGRGAQLSDTLDVPALTEDEIDFTLKNMASGRYRQILEAIQRINSGVYGTCGTCGQSIDLERLEIIPEATFCVTCQRSREAQSKTEFNSAMNEFDALSE